MKIKHYSTDTVCYYYLSAIINGDSSGLEDEEVQQLDDYLKTLPENAIFDCGDDIGFYRDAISGLMGDCVELNIFEQVE